jgi:aspartate/methionine/tyrosine aminotransferase
MFPPVARRAESIASFLMMDILEEALELEARGEEIVHLEVGEPDFPTPQCIVNEARRALEAGRTRYTHSQGALELRQAISDDYRGRCGVEVDANNMIVTSGSSPAMLLVLGALIEPGDQVLLSDPGYACYPAFVRFCGGEWVFFPVRASDGFVPQPDIIRAHMSARVKTIILNSPANPTGAVVPQEFLREIASLGCTVVSDEIYHGLTYGVPAHSILEFTDRCFVVNGFSKRYAMRGWRLGYAIAPPDFIRPMQKLQQNLFISANTFVQAAAVAALGKAGADAEKMRLTFDERRKFIVPALRELGFGVESYPEGAYYVLAEASRFGDDSLALSRRILHGAKVALAPGIDFGRNAEGHLRFSYANSLENIKRAMEALANFLYP